MKFKKLILNILLVITVICVSFLAFNNNVQAETVEYEYIPTSTGGDLTYRGTNVKVLAPKNYVQKTTEFRGVWVSPFAGDITGFTDSETAFKERLLSVLDDMEKYNLNAIMFHLRTHNDALYDTNLAPKSSYVSAADFKEWDYVEWFIEECHSRGIEFHAWLNPYRISSGSITMSQVLNKYADYRSNPARKAENVLISSDPANPGAILDPGRPEVKEYLVDVCMEIVKKYDVDAIHFDDYFYMKGIDDSATYQMYKSEYNNASLANFRRLQIDDFIEQLSKEMYDYNIKNNRAVQLGISPSGVYQNGGYNTNYQYDENGTLVSPSYSNTAGYAHYDAPLYSDTKKWIDNEWIDYITPQLYGSFESKGCSYADAVDWWSQVVKYKQVNLYAGIGIYKSQSDSTDAGWYPKGNRTFEYILKYNQTQEQVDGFCLYQYKSVKNYGVTNPDFKYVFTNFLTNKAATPKVPRYSLEVDEPTNLQLVKGDNTMNLIFDKVDNAYRYAIYRAEGQNAEIDVNDPNHLVRVVGNSEINTVIFEGENNDYTYGIRAISQSNEFSDLVVISGKDAKTSSDLPIGKFNDIGISGTIKTKGYFTLEIAKPNIYYGSDVSYKIYRSTDKINWELVKDLKPMTTLSYDVRCQFNEDLKPEYFKVEMINGFGKVESEIIKVDIKRIDLIEVFSYELNEMKNALLDLFKE